MPFNVSNPPDKLKGLPAKKQRQWVEVFNSCWDKHHDDETCHKMAWGVVKKASDSHCVLALESEPREVEHNDKYAPTSPCMYGSDCVIARELLHIALDLQDDEPIIAMGLLDEVKALKLKSRVIEFYKEMRGFQAELADFIGDLKDGVKNPRALSNFPEIADFIGLEKQLRVGPLRHAYETEQMIADKMLQVVKADA